MAVASPDKDFFQLLRPGIILLRPPKKPAAGARVSKYALVPYATADFEQASLQRSRAPLARSSGPDRGLRNAWQAPEPALPA